MMATLVWMVIGAARWRRATLWSLLCAVFLSSLSLASQVDVLTQANNDTRTGANLQETTLMTSSVQSGNFGLLWKLYSDAKIMAQPLYVSNLMSPACPSGCNTVIFCSMKG